MADISRRNDYKDLDLDFLAHPITKDVVRKTGPDAVARAIRNIILTNFYDRPFQSYIGTNVQKILFDNMTPTTARLLEQFITDAINNFEPRATVIGVKVTTNIDYNGYDAKIVFSVNNRPEPYVLTTFLERIR